MKVIYMNCNINKSLREQKTKALSELFSIKTREKIANMSKEEVDIFFNNINEDINLKNKKEFEIMYLNYFIASKKIRKSNLKKHTTKLADISIEEIDLIKNKDINNRFIEIINNVVVKLMIFMNKKKTKKIIFSAIAIALTLSCYRLEQTTALCLSGNMGKSIDNAFFYIRNISGVICFICMTIEIIQNAVQGDVRVIWYVVAKYLAIMVAILSFRSIFNIIDGIFNG